MGEIKKLKDSFFKAFVENSTESMVLIDDSGDLKIANASFLNLLNHSLNELKDRQFKNLLLEKDQIQFEKFLESVKKNEIVKNYKFYLLTSQKSIVRLFISANILKNEDKIEGYFLSFSPVHPDDWSALKDPHIFQSIAKKLGRLTSIGQMTSVFAHDIKNPLHVILSTSELLVSENIDEKFKTSVDLITRNAQRASKIVKTLLDFSRSGMCQLRPYSINDIVDYALSLFESSLKTSKVKITKNLENVPKVFLDTNYLNSVVYNLIANALESMSERENGEIAVKSRYTGKEVELKILDNGRGIEKNMLNNLFHPFFTTKENGTGLGLYLARQIMNEHSGQIKIESKFHKGTAVTLRFSKIA